MAALNSFLMNCMDSSEIDYLSEIYGDDAFLIYVKLRQKIHSEGGYYCNWDKEKHSPQLFLKRRFSSISKLSLELIENVVEAALDNGIFDRELYEKYHILTGKEIQENYIQAVARRKNAEIKPEYLLLNKASANSTESVEQSVSLSTNSTENKKNVELSVNSAEFAPQGSTELSANSIEFASQASTEVASTNSVEIASASASASVKADCCDHSGAVVAKEDITVGDNVVAFKGSDLSFGLGLDFCKGNGDYDDNNYNIIVDVKGNDGGADDGTDFNAVYDVKNDNVTTMQQDVTSMQHDVSLIEENRREENRTEFKRERKRERSLPLPTLAPCGMYNNVVLKASELDRLKVDYPHCYMQYIDELSSYIESTGKKYSSHYATLLRWIKDGEKKRTVKNVRAGGYKPKQYSNAFNDFSQRSYTEDDFREIIKRKGGL